MSPNGEFKKYLSAIGDTIEDLPRAGMASHHVTNPASHLASHLGHLDEDELMAFHQQRLSAAERESAESHLKECGICAAKFDDVRDFFEPLYIGEKDWSEFEQQKTWRELRGRLPFEARQAAPPPFPARARFQFNSRAMMALAAGLLLTTSLTAAVAIRLYRQNRDLQVLLDQNRNEMVAKIGAQERSAPNANDHVPIPKAPDPSLPQINTTIREITVYDTVRSTKNGKDALVTTLPAKAEYFAFTLDLASDSHPTYRIEFTDLNGKSILSQRNLKPNERGNEKFSEPRPDQRATVSVSIPRQSLKPGQYLFQIYGQKGAEPVLLEALSWSFN